MNLKFRQATREDLPKIVQALGNEIKVEMIFKSDSKLLPDTVQFGYDGLMIEI